MIGMREGNANNQGGNYISKYGKWFLKESTDVCKTKVTQEVESEELENGFILK